MEEERTERQDSIEVDQNGKKEYAFHVKCYYDSNVTHPEEIISRIANIYKDLHERFK